MWIRDALPYDLTSEDENPIARIMVYGYESKIAQSDNIQNLEDLGTALHSSLLPLTHGRTLKPIIFVAHSLGGLIIKQVCLLSNNRLLNIALLIGSIGYRLTR